MAEILSLADFIKAPGVALDVRSPGEYCHAHIPGALSLPLFTNAERAEVGTAYKQQGQKEAIALGLKLVGPKLAELMAQAHALTNGQPAKVYCWRGGMRSNSMAWLLNLGGIPTTLLQGGYKTFRRWALDLIPLPYRFIVIGGMTGSGKTTILHALRSLDEQILDLEALANHRGSAYGRVGMSEQQPSNEQFENDIAIKLSTLDPQRPIWIEDESRMIGTCHVPPPIFSQMSAAPFIAINIPFEERLKRLLTDYGHTPLEHLAAATNRISRQLGGQRTKEVLANLSEGNLLDAMITVLQYYDSAYAYALTRRSAPCASLSAENISPLEWARRLKQQAPQLLLQLPLEAAL